MTSPVPGDVAAPLLHALAVEFGSGVELTGARPASGGCIHHAAGVETTGGTVFVKWNRGAAGAGFASEARALRALREAAEKDGILAVPRVLGVRDGEGDAPGWLALEYLPPSPEAPDHARTLGEGLARLHLRGAGGIPPPADPGPPAGATGRFGWFETNRIGPLEQVNPWTDDWVTFWRDARLRPQLEAAYREGALPANDRRWSDPLHRAVAPALGPVAHAAPALLHGDLWSGNVHPGPDGRPVLVDPATYLGHGEVDLAMARLFGGFSPATFRRYREILPEAEGFEETRLPLYQLYYLLVHVRLFGASYLEGARRAARAVLRSVG